MHLPSGHTLRIGAVSAALVGLSAISLANLASSALLTDSKAAGPAAVTSGNVALTLGTTTFSNFASSASAPGDAKYTLITVTNSGSLALRYSATLTWSVSNALTQSMQFGVIKVATSSSTCDGTLSWTTAVDNATYLAKDVTASGTSIALFGNNSTGAQTGDRALAAAASDYLCVRQLEPLTYSTNTVVTSTLGLTFDSEQTANN